jgi:hypothetical protein
MDDTHPSLDVDDSPKPSSGLCSEKSEKSPNNIIGMMDSNRDYLITLMNSNRHFYGNSAH